MVEEVAAPIAEAEVVVQTLVVVVLEVIPKVHLHRGGRTPVILLAGKVQPKILVGIHPLVLPAWAGVARLDPPVVQVETGKDNLPLIFDPNTICARHIRIEATTLVDQLEVMSLQHRVLSSTTTERTQEMGGLSQICRSLVKYLLLSFRGILEVSKDEPLSS